jgi:hypothetical protein
MSRSLGKSAPGRICTAFGTRNQGGVRAVSSIGDGDHKFPVALSKQAT